MHVLGEVPGRGRREKDLKERESEESKGITIETVMEEEKY